MKSFFITGVDTDIGKTFASLGLCLKLRSENYRVGYFKPLQSGAYYKEDTNTLLAPDIETIKKFDNSVLTKCSYLLKGEVSPYLASKKANINVDFLKIKNDLDEFNKNLDYSIVEGAGGLMCPLAQGKLFCDLIKFLDLETIIVTTPNLGRLNHTLMTESIIKQFGIKVKGLIINGVKKEKTESEAHFVEELKAFSNIKILAQIPKLNNPSKDQIIEAFKGIDL